MLCLKRQSIIRVIVKEMAPSAAVFRSDVYLCRGFQTDPCSVSASNSSSSEQFCFFKFPVSTRFYGTTTSTVRACVDSDSHNNRDPRRRSLHTNSKGNNGGLRSSGFDHHKAQFIRDLELNGISALQDVHTSDAPSWTPNGSEAATYGRRNLLGFPNHSLPRDKIVVAVDVDEGIFLCLIIVLWILLLL